MKTNNQASQNINKDKLEKFILSHFNIMKEEQIYIPLLIDRCTQEAQAFEHPLTEHDLYRLVDDELYKILDSIKRGATAELI